MTAENFRKLALSFENTEEQAHFDKMAFKVISKRIFATLHQESLTAYLKLSEIDQSAFSSFHTSGVYPLPNKWGLQGWTTIELEKAPEELITDALTTAYKEVFKPSKKHR